MSGGKIGGSFSSRDAEVLILLHQLAVLRRLVGLPRFSRTDGTIVPQLAILVLGRFHDSRARRDRVHHVVTCPGASSISLSHAFWLIADGRF